MAHLPLYVEQIVQGEMVFKQSVIELTLFEKREKR